MLEAVLLHAAQLGHISRLKTYIKQLQFLSLDYQNELGQTALLLASAGGHDACVQLLLAHGASIDLCDNEGQSPLLLSCRNHHFSTVTLLLTHQATLTPSILLEMQRISYPEFPSFQQQYYWSRRRGFLHMYLKLRRMQIV